MRLALASLFLLPTLALAQSSGEVIDTPEQTGIPAGFGTVTIEQTSLTDVQGAWLLQLPDATQRSGDSSTETIANTPSGNYVIYATLPSGMASTIRIYRNGTLDKFYERQQTPFVVYPNEDVRVSINYHLARYGTISVQSDPPGTAFTLYGPDSVTYAGTTPQSYEGVPIGQYKVQYSSFGNGCVTPAPQASQLDENSRISFNIRFDCDMANKVRERTTNSKQNFLTITIGKAQVQLLDVLQSDWFSPFVYAAAKRDILTGYRDSEGNPTGTFGPGNNVTVAELSKIAHRMAGISEEAFANIDPKNASGAHQWFSPFLASSENRGWLIYSDGTIDPVRPATRGEVVVTLLQAFNIPLQWQKGNVFKDVPVLYPYASAIETAAADGIVSGRTDADGTNLHMFDPNAPITRAEISKIITTMLDTYKAPTTAHNAVSQEKTN